MECSICYENIKEKGVVTYCNHRFHMECLVTWKRAKENASCPLCRCTPLVAIDDVDIETLRKSYMGVMMENKKMEKDLELLKMSYRSVYEERTVLQRQITLLSNRLTIINKLLATTTSLANDE